MKRSILAAIMLLPMQLAAQPPPEGPRLSVQIVAPKPEERFWVTQPTVELALRITTTAGLKQLGAEVTGEKTGTFFDICSSEGGAQPCKDDRPTVELKTSCPVFPGRNLVKLRAVDRDDHPSEASVEIHVSIASGTPMSSAPPPAQGETLGAAAREEVGREGRYALLILTHRKPFGEDFEAALQPLVKHKSLTGIPTILETLDDIYEDPTLRGRDHPEIVKNAIASEAKRLGVRYVMLVGDSDRFPVRYTRTYDLGHWGHGFSPSDLYYADLFRADGSFDSWDYDDDGLFGEMQGNFPNNAQDLNQDRLDLLPDVAVGRVPVSNLQELTNYVQKVIAYEKGGGGVWFKRALLVTGDYPSSNTTNDAIGTQLSSRSFKLNKQYHDVVWPSTTTAQRQAIIENALNRGVGFVSYVGHGWGASGAGKDGGGWGGWWDYTRIGHLSNQSRLPIVFSAACETGMFHFGYGPYFAKWGFKYETPVEPLKYSWAPEPTSFSPSAYDKDALAEHLLAKGPQGAVAFIGAYTGTQGESHALAKYFFEAYASGATTVGDAWNGALRSFVSGVINKLSYPGHSWHTAARYHHIHKMLLFGDPSLRIGGLQPDLAAKADPSGGFCRRTGGKLLVTVVNLGAGRAEASAIAADFGEYGRVQVALGALEAGAAQDLVVDIPPRCFDPDCGFRITVDPASAVAEGNETNNTAADTCIG